MAMSAAHGLLLEDMAALIFLGARLYRSTVALCTLHCTLEAAETQRHTDLSIWMRRYLPGFLDT